MAQKKKEINILEKAFKNIFEISKTHETIFNYM